MRPPYWSVQTPSNRRTSDPVKIGVPTSNPNCVSFSPRSSLMAIPVIANNVHTAKQIVNAKVLSPSALFCCPALTASRTGMIDSRLPFALLSATMDKRLVAWLIQIKERDVQ